MDNRAGVSKSDEAKVKEGRVAGHDDYMRSHTDLQVSEQRWREKATCGNVDAKEPFALGLRAASGEALAADDLEQRQLGTEAFTQRSSERGCRCGRGGAVHRGAGGEGV